nr:hypothetical protein [uncultured Mediterraneibacter sp.]
MSITPLIGMEDARIVLNVSRPSPKAILNGEKKILQFDNLYRKCYTRI